MSYYNIFGLLIEEDVTVGETTTTTKYAVDGWNSNMAAPVGNENFNTWAVLNADNTLQTRNLFGNTPGQILGRIDQSGASDASGTYWDLSDHLGSVRDVVNNSGTLKDSIAYDSYGNIVGTELDYLDRGMYAWTGQQLDVQTGLQYDRARWYDSESGRWMSQDPMGFDAGDSNLYRYVTNSPTVSIDPSGESPKCAIYPTTPISPTTSSGWAAYMPYADEAAVPYMPYADEKKGLGISDFEESELPQLGMPQATIEVATTKTYSVAAANLGGNFSLDAKWRIAGELQTQANSNMVSGSGNWFATFDLTASVEKRFRTVLGTFILSAGFSMTASVSSQINGSFDNTAGGVLSGRGKAFVAARVNAKCTFQSPSGNSRPIINWGISGGIDISSFSFTGFKVKIVNGGLVILNFPVFDAALSGRIDFFATPPGRGQTVRTNYSPVGQQISLSNYRPSP